MKVLRVVGGVVLPHSLGHGTLGLTCRQSSGLLTRSSLTAASLAGADETRIGQVAFLFGGFLGQDVAFVSVFALDFAASVKSKRFLAPEFVFILGILLNVLKKLNSPQKYD